MKPTGPTNPELQRLVSELKKKSHTETAGVWKRIALNLEKPRRQRRVVNLSRINRYTKENDTVVVPGKVLGAGSLDHKVNVAAFCFSSSAIETIMKHNGTALSIVELLNKNPKGKNIIIIG
jgi:large subunit ribosomal protein L18e